MSRTYPPVSRKSRIGANVVPFNSSISNIPLNKSLVLSDAPTFLCRPFCEFKASNASIMTARQDTDDFVLGIREEPYVRSGCRKSDHDISAFISAVDAIGNLSLPFLLGNILAVLEWA